MLTTATEEQRLYDPNAENFGFSREQQILLELKRSLGWSPSITLDASVDAFLLRYLSAVHFSVSEAVALLKQRRSYEVSLPSLHITVAVLEVLRSGAVSVIGRDVLGRPVLCITSQHMSQFTLETEDLQRLVTVIMEYMLSYCSQAPLSVSSGNRNADTVSQTQVQQIIILVNEELSSWHGSQAALANLNAIESIISKYYPRFIGLVLVFGASWDVRQGVKTAFPDKSGEARRVVQTVTVGNIQQYIDRSVLTPELGGNNTSVATPDMFADTVLSHWYNMRSYLTVEDTMSRPLWQLPPFFVNVSDWNLLQRRSTAVIRSPSMLSARSSPSPHQSYFNRRASSYYDPVGSGLRRSIAFRGAGDEDDGFCSVISDVDDMAHTNASIRITPKEASFDMDVINNTPQAALVRELQRERELRIAAEQQLKKMRLGITLDLEMATEIERTLTVMHAELNVLVGNVVVRAKEAAEKGSPPTLLQLLDLTLSALEMAAHKAQRVPAMKFAMPVSQELPPSTSCCSMM